MANLVNAHSEDKSKTWDERKTAAIEHLAKADKRLKMLVMADKASNLRSIAADYEYWGDSLWDRFNAPIIGEGMRTNVTQAANIRMIEPYKNSALRFEELLPLMNVTFVRNGQLTVVPFPFKYLREYIQSV